MISNSLRERILSKITFLQKQKNNFNFWNITDEQGVFLSNLVKFVEPKSVLEIGTSNGFSTLYLCLNLIDEAKVTTIEVSSERFEISRKNFEEVGLSNVINLVNSEAVDFLGDCSDVFNFIFVDAGHQFYEDIFNLIISRKLFVSGGVLVFDNVTSHVILEDFVKRVLSEFSAELIDLGGGMLVVSFN